MFYWFSHGMCFLRVKIRLVIVSYADDKSTRVSYKGVFYKLIMSVKGNKGQLLQIPVIVVGQGHVWVFWLINVFIFFLYWIASLRRTYFHASCLERKMILKEILMMQQFKVWIIKNQILLKEKENTIDCQS